MKKIAAVVVTCNRKKLLLQCLDALANQTRKPEAILIVDNASTDGSCETLKREGWLGREDLEMLSLPDNTGGAGGFAAGLERAVEDGADWVWMMDDDALPHADALEQLLVHGLTPKNIYGSVAIAGNVLSWPTHGLKDLEVGPVRYVSQLPSATDVPFVPFLGIFISSAMVRRIGLPDAGFFLAADDVDYSLRAREHNAHIVLVSASRIEHPLSMQYQVWLPWRYLICLRLAPWKRYYDVRNRLFVARNHYGAALWYSTLPGSFLRLLATLWHEGHRWQQVRAFYAGMVDGLLWRKGKRHEIWGIK